MSWIHQLLLIVAGACEVSVSEFSLNKYHSYEELTSFLHELARENTEIAKLYSIGQSFEGRELWVIEISAGRSKSLRPNVKLVGNIHGNEAVGREILLQLSKFLLGSYKSGDERIRSLLDFSRVHILPSLNPDGFKLALNFSKWGGANQCSSGHGRNNILDLDLNRNFPDPFRLTRVPIQNETRAVVNWLREVPFVLSASLHGGALVASYPYDSRKKDVWEEFFSNFNVSQLTQEEVIKLWKKWRPVSNPQEPHLTPDDDVFEHLAVGYASRHPVMHKGEACPGPYSASFPRGVTNGAAWYHLTGGMQDYNYIAHGCMELTLEISCCKFPNPTDLHNYWEDNREPLLSYLEEVRRGIRGVVVDEEGLPIPKASLYVKGRDMPFHTTKNGEFWRILLPNSYLLQVDADGFQSQTIPIKINEPEPNKWSQFINITLYRNESMEIKTNQATWSNASKVDDTDQETVSPPELSTIEIKTKSQTVSSSEAVSSSENPYVNQPRSYLVEESKSSSDLTHDCILYVIVLVPLSVLYF